MARPHASKAAPALLALFALAALALVRPAAALSTGLDLVLAASEFEVSEAVTAGHRVHGASDRFLVLTVPRGAAVARDFEELARVPYLRDATYFMVELEGPAASADVWSARLPRDGSVQLVHALADRALYVARGNSMPAQLVEAFPRTATFHALAPHPFRPARPQSFDTNIVRRDAVADLIAQVSRDQLEKYVTYLTGEAAGSPFTTRQAQSPEAVDATVWVEEQLAGLRYTTSRPQFSAQYCPNVVGEWRGVDEPERYVVVGAHLDDRAQVLSDSRVRAPGANDDGSGSALVLEIARVLSSYNASFRYTVLLMTFCAEEQGLIGSRALAKDLADDGVDIVAMLQADMVAYQRGPEPELSFVNRYVDMNLMRFVQNVTATYLPDLATSETSACCSDHQSFLENGYASAGFVEAGGYTIDPQYHNTNDLVYRSGYSFEQLTLITQAVLASLAVLAELK